MIPPSTLLSIATVVLHSSVSRSPTSTLNPAPLTVSLLCPDYNYSDGFCWSINLMQLIVMLTIVHLSSVGHPAFFRSDEHSIYGMDGA
jgi:hypothetical protein